jgi:hypothetical protein
MTNKLDIMKARLSPFQLDLINCETLDIKKLAEIYGISPSLPSNDQ